MRRRLGHLSVITFLGLWFWFLVAVFGAGCRWFQPDCRLMGCPAGTHCAMDDTVVPVVYKCVQDEPTPPPETCPDGQCVVGWTNSIPPHVICGPCEPPKPPKPPKPCMDPVDLVENEVQGPAQLQKYVQRAIAELGDPTGQPPNETLGRLAAKLCEMGLSAFAGDEAVFVKRADGLFEEYHAVYFGDGGWTDSGNGKYIGLHRLVTPEPEKVCSAPLPDTTPGKLEIGCKPHGRWVDCTIKTVMTCDYCRAIGMGCYGPDPPCDTPRCGCPMRPEGALDRLACEMFAAKWGVVWQTQPAGHEVELHDGNPWQARTDPGVQLRACNADGTVCGNWVDQP